MKIKSQPTSSSPRKRSAGKQDKQEPLPQDRIYDHHLKFVHPDLL